MKKIISPEQTFFTQHGKFSISPLAENTRLVDFALANCKSLPIETSVNLHVYDIASVKIIKNWNYSPNTEYDDTIVFSYTYNVRSNTLTIYTKRL